MQTITSHQQPPPLNEHKPLNHAKKPNLEERKKTATTITTSQPPPKNLTIKP